MVEKWAITPTVSNREDQMPLKRPTFLITFQLFTELIFVIRKKLYIFAELQTAALSAFTSIIRKCIEHIQAYRIYWKTTQSKPL